jgi:hypothetical protein
LPRWQHPALLFIHRGLPDRISLKVRQRHDR